YVYTSKRRYTRLSVDWSSDVCSSDLDRFGNTGPMPHTRLQRSLRVTFVGMVANALLAAAKMVTGVAGHSHALVADGIESLADLLSSAIVWRGLVVAAAPADKDHPYGHGTAEPIAAAV